MLNPGGQAAVWRSFGRVLRAQRTEQDLSHERLAGSSGLHRTCISLLERGVYTPSLDATFALARALEVEPSDLIAPVLTPGGLPQCGPPHNS